MSALFIRYYDTTWLKDDKRRGVPWDARRVVLHIFSGRRKRRPYVFPNFTMNQSHVEQGLRRGVPWDARRRGPSILQRAPQATPLRFPELYDEPVPRRAGPS